MPRPQNIVPSYRLTTHRPSRRHPLGRRPEAGHLPSRGHGPPRSPSGRRRRR